MSRDRGKKFKHSRDVRSSGWFRPSREDAALYCVLIKAERALSVKELSSLSGAAPSTVDHTARYWTERGLLQRAFLDKKAWYRWAPGPKAKEMAEALSAAADLADAVPKGATPRAPPPPTTHTPSRRPPPL